jgi:uncharacterized protein YgbK (DUF1537 family)
MEGKWGAERMRLEEVRNRWGKEKPDEIMVDRLLEEEQQRSRRKIVVLDDDPTGTQTIHGVSVYTDWSVSSLKRGFEEGNPLFYILTNSRALSESQTARLHRELTHHLVKAARETSREFLLLSRSDSTLRGHYPLETEQIRQALEQETAVSIDGEILFPFFQEGGRITVDNIHYAEENGRLVPAAETEFARDPTFGYQSSNLCDYIEEKTHGRYLAEDTISISLESLRRLEIGRINSALCSVHDFGKIVVNAVDYIDAKVFCIALFRAMAAGRHYLIRCAASFVKTIGGIPTKPLLTRRELIKEDPPVGGLVVIGSYTDKTTEQMEQLKKARQVHFIEFPADCVLRSADLKQEIIRIAGQAEDIIREKQTAVLFTSRKLLTVPGDGKKDILARSVQISEALCGIVKRLQAPPGFLLTKGGITSSDIAVKALGVRKAKVLGQIRTGIPVWETDSGSLYLGVPYIIFPGNVGTKDTLYDIIRILQGEMGEEEPHCPENTGRRYKS